MNEIDKTIERLESELNLSVGFFDALKNEDDWSFIVKCHALIESACSFLLTAYFDNPSYEDVFSRLEMSDKKKGKIAFLRATGLIVPEEERFIIGLSELRNKLIHNIRGVAFSFSKHIDSLDKNQKQAFAKCFGYAYLKETENGKLILTDNSIVITDPKFTVLNGVKLILALIMLQVETGRLKKKTEELQKETYQLMDSLTSTFSGAQGSCVR